MVFSRSGSALVSFALLACLLPLHASKPNHSDAERQAGLERLFAAIDSNRDGQLDAAETEQYVAASLDLNQEGWSARAATEASREALDGPDAGATVSVSELAAHLQALLQDHQVEEWVTHGLNQPQHAVAFKRNAITALDFPFLVSDGGATLETDLGVASKLHQQQILRGMKRLILGLGELPAAPQHLECAALNKSAIRLSWQAPASSGHPAFHKYVLQRQRIAGPGAAAVAGVAPAVVSGGGGASTGRRSSSSSSEERWEAAGEPDDEDSSWVDVPPAKGRYRYRLAAWSAYGRGPYAVSSAACAVRAVQHRPVAPTPLAAADVQALLAAMAAGNLSAAKAGASAAGSGAWSWSAASSAAVVALTILLKASQLRVGSGLQLLWRQLLARLAGRWHPAEAAASDGAALQEQEEEEYVDGGMLPASSSGALLAGEGAVDRLAGQAVQPLLLAGSSSMQRCGSSTQLLAGSSKALTAQQPGASQADACGWDAAAAAAEMDEAANPAVEQLQQAIQRGAHCAHPGCHRRFDRLRDMRRRLESHFCGLCQHVFCLQHTRVSPHGPRGGCGLESQCICFACFAELAPAQQTACERLNRLPKPTGPAANATASNDASHLAAAAAAAAATAGAAGAAASVGVRPHDNLSNEAAPAAVHLSSTYNVSTTGATGAANVARQRWRRAGSVMQALVRFKAAGSNPASRGGPPARQPGRQT